MNPKSACAVLNKFLFHGLAEGVFYAVQQHKVTLVGSTASLQPIVPLGMITNGAIAAGEYLKLLEDGSYSAVFSDGAIAYIECVFNNGVLDSYRFFYIPPPFHPSHLVGLPSDIPLADWFRLVLDDQGANCLQSVGALRFDCVRGLPDDVETPHPVSHLTMLSGDCRIPIRGPVQINTFLHFVFDNFQRVARPFWLQFSSYLTFDTSEVTITSSETAIMHLNWENAD